MYVCGPTVYDEPHIGHARSAYIFDVIRRYFKYKEYKVKFVRNVTDVDDKIIDKAQREFAGEDLNSAIKKVAEKYLKAYHQALDRLNMNIQPEEIVEPRASEYIGKMTIFIKNLIDKGVAYQSGGDVYFDITRATDYGKLSNQNLDKLKEGARIQSGENKKNALDFALWKAAKENEPSWDSPWGKGRPGWHIECSVMSSDILGDKFDIHGGGIDLIFPHHENEIAQSEGAGKKFAQVWIHHGLLTINGQKMAKSAGNFVTVKTFMDKYEYADILKLFFLSTHYSHPIDYNEEKIGEVRKQKKSFDNFFSRLSHWLITKEGKLKTPATKEDTGKVDAICAKFQEAMEDDFNTPQALACLFELIDLSAGFVSADKKDGFDYIKPRLENLLNIFGLRPGSKKEWAAEDTKKLKEREEAKKNKDYKKADSIREEIEKKYSGVLMDTGSGVTFIEG